MLPILILAGACLAAIAPFLWWGSPSGHDFEFHMYSWMEVLGQWKLGVVYPSWAALAHWGYGEARFIFYPPASWTLGATLGAILPWRAVPGAYCWIALLLAGVAMYRLAREWFRPPDALFAAVFYALNPYSLLVVYWRSAYAELLAAALLPLLLLCVLRLQRPGPRPILHLSLVLAAAWLTNAPAAVMVHYSLAVLVWSIAAATAMRNRSWGTDVWRPLVCGAIAVVVGAGLASFYLIPAIYEQGWINLAQVLSPGVRPQDNFLFTTIADADHNRFNLLISIVALAEIAALGFVMWFSLRRVGPHSANHSNQIQVIANSFPKSHHQNLDLRSYWMPLAVWGSACAFVMFPLSHVLWGDLPKFRFVQLPFRWLLCMNVALVLLAVIAIRRWWTRAFACVALLTVLVIAGYRIQPPWWDTGDDIRELSDTMTDGSGYEGTDEYVPAAADPYELNKALPRISRAGVAEADATILTWAPTEKHMRIHAPAPQNLTIRLFDYPAWQVQVNGRTVASRKTRVTGLIVVPIEGGDNDIRIAFRRTGDRLAGTLVSLFSLLGFVVAWFQRAWRRRLASDMDEKVIENAAA